MNPFISRIRIYPIKSLDPVELPQAEVGHHSLRYDREFAMLGHDGRFVNGKRTGRVNELRAVYDMGKYLVTLAPRAGGGPRTFHLLEEKKELELYLTDYFEVPLSLIHNTGGELMDIPVVSSVTLISEASLQSLQTDMITHSLEELRLRFRPNFEVGGVDPYWEEQLFGEPGTGIEFLVGDVKMIGISPRARCNVPPRHPFTGETDKSFIKSMMKSRTNSLPANSKLLKHGNLYQLTVNVHIPETEVGKIIKLNDEIKIIGTVALQVS